MGLTFIENPPETAENYPHPAEVSSPWVVACTYARCEKKLANLLFSRHPEIPYFLPLLAKKSQSRNISISPLFPGFVFVAASPLSINQPEAEVLEQAIKDLCVSTGHVHSFLTTRDQSRLRRELGFLATTPQNKRDVRNDFPPGRRVRIRSGPLMGLEGVVHSQDKNRITIELEILGRFVSTDFEGVFALELI